MSYKWYDWRVGSTFREWKSYAMLASTTNYKGTKLPSKILLPLRPHLKIAAFLDGALIFLLLFLSRKKVNGEKRRNIWAQLINKKLWVMYKKLWVMYKKLWVISYEL